MPTNEKKGVTVKIDAELHAEVRQYIEQHEMTMGEFVSIALQNELHPKLNMEDKNMGNMRTLAFQVPEELFQKIKDYLQRNNMTQKEFVIGLIETEINRDLTQRATMNEEAPQERSEPQETEDYEEQEDDDFEEDLEAEDEEMDEEQDENEIEEQDESENLDMSMGM